MANQYEAVRKIHAPVENPPKGQHLWVWVAMFRADDPEADKIVMGDEQLITIDGPGCYLCEQPYSPEIARKPCKGNPGGNPCPT